MTFFYFLPSLLLSGFMFPFRGMPEWAQWIGGFLPLTHFLRVVRGVLLKGAPMSSIAPSSERSCCSFWRSRADAAQVPADAGLSE